MEAGGDTTGPPPGDVEDLEDTRFPSEVAGDGGGLREDPPDPGDGDQEETGMPSPHSGLGRNPYGVSLLREVNGGPAKSLLGLRKVA